MPYLSTVTSSGSYSYTVSGDCYISSNLTTCGTTTTAVVDVVWSNWCNAVAANTATNAQALSQAVYNQQAAGNVAEIVANAERELAASRAEIELKAEMADSRARRLLELMLDDRQRAQFRTQRVFEVMSRQNGTVRRYLVTEGYVGNVFRLNDKDEMIEKFCIHCDSIRIPVADNMLAQKLMLESDEARFLRIANRSVRGGGGWVRAERAA